MYEGTEEEKADELCRAFSTYGELRAAQGNYVDAVIFAEENYNCAAVAYNPVHPKVQRAASFLIEYLNHSGEIDRAETFAQLTLESLKDPMNGLDQESKEVARGYYNLGNVIHGQKGGDLVKAEMLVRESLRIGTRLSGDDDFDVGCCAGLLANILRSNSKLGYETKELFERSLAMSIKYCGRDGFNTAVNYFNMGRYYYTLAEVQGTAEMIREGYLLLSESNHMEALRIHSKIRGPDNPITEGALSSLTII